MASSALLVRFLTRRFGAVVTGIAVVQAALLVVLRPGVLSIDEVTYLAMARSAAHGNLLGVDNGLDLGASTELESELVREVGGRLVAQYPAGFALLSAPFYALFGGAALLVLNIAAFYGTVLFTRRIARRVLGSERVALLAAGIFACGTFAFEYGAALWPHAITTLLTCAATDATLVAGAEREPSRAAARRFVAGLLVGLATTIRLDAMIVVPALLLVPPVLDGKTASWKHAASLLAGTVPALLFLAITNHVKFGTWMPLSYGPWQGQGSNTGASSYTALALLGLAGLLAVHAYARRPERFERRHFAAALVVGVLASLLVAPLRNAGLRLIDGLWTLLVDLRHREMDALEAALTRSPRGGMIYIGTFKKSLLQSLPYLALLPFSLGGTCRDPLVRRRKLAIALPIAAYAFVLGAFRWHGGLSVNLRYFVPFLPFVAVLAADGLSRLARRASGSLRALRVADVALLASTALYIETGVLLRLPSATIATREIFYLDVPLVLASMLAVAIATVSLLGRGKARARAASVAFLLGIATLSWAGLTEVTYDAVAVAKIRLRGRAVAARARAHVGPGSLLIVEMADPFAQLLDDGVVLATGSRDLFGAAARLVNASTCLGRRSYAILSKGSLTTLAEKAGALVEVRELAAPQDDGWVTAELIARAPLCSPPQGR